MSYTVEAKITKLSLVIPRADFPLKNNAIIGHEYPELKYQDDECSFECRDLKVVGDTWVLELEDFYCWAEELFDDLVAVVMIYKGTLIADLQGEESGDITYIRIRDGVKKKVKIIEEED